MRCDGSADPSIAGEINTYINLEREDTSHNSIEDVLPKCRHTREVSAEQEEEYSEKGQSHSTKKSL